MKPALSPVASSLLRALIARGEVERDRIYLIDWTAKDWASLTFTGERHIVRLRITPPHADIISARILDDIGEAEFHLPGHFVADIAAASKPLACSDGSSEIEIQALTLAEA